MMGALASSPVARAAGLALVQFLWQGALIGVAAWLALRMLTRASAGRRYAVACLALTVMVAAPVATALLAFRNPSAVVYASNTLDDQTAAASSPPVAGLDPIQPLTPVQSWFHSALPARAWIESRLPWIVLLWAAGVLGFGLRLAIGGLRLRRIRRSATIVSGHAVSVAQALGRRLGVRKHIRLLASPRVIVPAVAGWIAPIILIPAGMLAGMPAAQFEAILAHELAHIRRGDFLINLLQCAAEVLLFFHPAVWWVSKQIRVERELCADDLAVTVSGDRVTYARALAALESFRVDSVLAMGAGGDLLSRIARLVDPGGTPPPRLSGGTAMPVALVILLLTSVAVPANIAPQEGPAQARSVASPPPPADTVKAPITAAARATVVEAPKKQAAGTQAGRGNLSGTVHDAQGGVLPGVTVVLTPVGASGRSVTTPPIQTVTNPRGTFAFDGLDPIEYDLTATLPGFQRHRSRLRIQADIREYANIQLDLGWVTSELVISASATPRSPANAGGAQGTATQYFDLAKVYYQQGRLLEAEEMTSRALQIIRSQTQATTLSTVPPRAVPIVRVGGEIREPKKTRDVKPIYPAEAAAAGIEGTVVVEATIGQDGSVKNARVLRSVAGLDDATLAAVRQWQFTPTLLNGVPVDVVMTVSVVFVR